MLINNAVITGSLSVNGTDVTYITGSSQISSSFLALSSSYLITSASYVVTSGSYAITSASFAQTSGSLSIRTGNLEATSSTLTSASSSFAAQSASLSTRLTTDETNITTLTNASASFAVVSSSFSSTSGSLSTRVTNLEATSSTVSSSFASTSGSIAGRVTLIEGQYATTGSNTFTNIQYISSSTNAAGFTTSASLYTDGGARIAKDLFVSGTTYLTNLTVYGTASVQYITSSQINVGANIIYLNTQTPAVRYGGMAVADSGSNAGVTGSMLWDSVNNGWIYTRESGSNYSGGALISGPRSSVQGSEQGTLNNYITKGQGGDHITSSQIIDDGTTVQIPGALQVTGSIVGSSTAAFSGNLTLNSGGDRILSINDTGGNLFQIQAASNILYYSARSTGGSLAFRTDGSNDVKLAIASTGAATFSSTVTTNGEYRVDPASGDGILRIYTAGTERAAVRANATKFYIEVGTFGERLSINNSSGLLTYIGAATFSGSGANSVVSLTVNGANSESTIAKFARGGSEKPFYISSSNNAFVNLATEGAFKFKVNVTADLPYSSGIEALTIASTGAATFSSSVTSSGTITAKDTTNDASVLMTGLDGAYGLIQANNAAGSLTKNLVLQKYGGNVGIGTSNPSNKLDVIVASSNSGVSSSGIAISDGAANRTLMFLGVNTAGYTYIQSNQDNVSSRPLVLQGSGGNVGIGTVSPNFKTHISTGSDTSITQPTAGTYGLYIQQNTSGNIGGLYIQDGASNSGNSIFVGDNNGAARFVVNTDGNVGIGTSSPSYSLDVKSSARILNDTGANSITNFYVAADKAGSSAPDPYNIGGIRSQFVDSAWLSAKTVLLGSALTGYGSPTERISFLTDGTNLITSMSGNVGIGTASPSAPLNVVLTSGGGYNPAISVSNTTITNYTQIGFAGTGRTYGVGVGNASSGLNVNDKYFIYDVTGAAVRFTVDTTGNVGIGTTSPSAKLHINGSTGASTYKGFAYTYAGSETLINEVLFQAVVGGYSSNLPIFLFKDERSDQGTTQRIFEIQGGRSGVGTILTTLASGNVGIGTASPDYKLQVSSATKGIGVNEGNIVIASNEALAANIGGSLGFGATSDYGLLTIAKVGGYRENATGTSASSYLAFETREGGNAVTEKFRISSNGTATISSTTYVPFKINTTYGQVGLEFQLNGTGFGGIGSATNFTGAYTGSSTDLGLGTNGSATSNIIFATGAGSTRRMTIFPGGQVAINRTDSGGGALSARGFGNTDAANAFYIDNSSSAELFSVRNDGVIRTGTAAGSPYNNTSAQVPNLYVSSGGTLERGTASSGRFKENIINWDGNGLDTILALKPRTFNYKKDYYDKADIEFLGLIAEEVAEVSPYLADYENEDRTGQVENVRYANIVVPLIKAIQEQQAQIEALKTEINELKNK